MSQQHLEPWTAVVVAIVAGCSRQLGEAVKKCLFLPAIQSHTNQPFRPDPGPSPVPKVETQDAFDDHLRPLYRFLVKSTILLGIAVVIAFLLSSGYVPTGAFKERGEVFNWSLNDILVAAIVVWFVSQLGILSNDDVTDWIEKVIIYTRVSSESQEEGTSLTSQYKEVREEAEKHVDEEDIETIEPGWESAGTMLRDSVDNLFETISNSEKNICVMFWSADRLTRADPFEAITFCWLLRREDTLLYFNDKGYFDFSDTIQELLFMNDCIQARQEYEKIINRGDTGQRTTKEQGGYPAAAPYGFYKDDDEDLVINQSQAVVIQRAAELVLKGDEDQGVPKGNVKQALQQLSSEFGDEDVDVPSYGTLLKILRRELYAGTVLHNGEVAREITPIIPPEEWDELQDVLGERQTRSESTEETELDHALLKAVERFGEPAGLEMFEEVVKGKCPECGDDVREWGSTTRMGRPVKRFRCEKHPEFNQDDQVDDDDGVDENVDNDSDDDGCDFEGPLLSRVTLQKWESSVPLTCPGCQGLLDDGEWTRSRSKLGAIEQTCEHCGFETTVTLSENKFRRAQEVPDVFRFFEAITQDEGDGGGQSGNESDETNEDGDDQDDGEDDPDNHDLDEYL